MFDIDNLTTVETLLDIMPNQVVTDIGEVLLVFSKCEKGDLDVALIDTQMVGRECRAVLTLDPKDSLLKIAAWVQVVSAKHSSDEVEVIDAGKMAHVIVVLMSQIKALNNDPDAKPVSSDIKSVNRFSSDEFHASLVINTNDTIQ